MWGIEGRWEPDLYVSVEHPDVPVYEVDLPGGLMGCVCHKTRTIWLARDLSPVQRRCTLAFEIGHLERGPAPADPALACLYHRDAAGWAARMLVSADVLYAVLITADTLAEAAALAGVDLPTLRARLRGLTDEEQDAIMQATNVRKSAA